MKDTLDLFFGFGRPPEGFRRGRCVAAGRRARLPGQRLVHAGGGLPCGEDPEPGHAATAETGALAGRLPALPAARPLDVLVVMAGNIPLVGFFDLLCVVIAGHRCLVKPSAKDTVLMEYVVGLLREIDPPYPSRSATGPRLRRP